MEFPTIIRHEANFNLDDKISNTSSFTDFRFGPLKFVLTASPCTLSSLKYYNIALELENMPTSVSLLPLGYHFHLRHNEARYGEISGRFCFTHTQKRNEVNQWICEELFNPLKVSGIVLYIVCEITIDWVDFYKLCQVNSDYNPGANLLTTGYLSDFSLVIGDAVIPVHKSILGQASPVWAAMFEHPEMCENIENQVVIEDIPLESVQLMLNFIYTGYEPYSIKLDTAFHLLLAADKYQIAPLKHVSERLLKALISMETVVPCLRAAIRHQAVELKTHAHKFISDNLITVVKRDDWIQLMQDEPRDVIEFFKSLKINN